MEQKKNSITTAIVAIAVLVAVVVAAGFAYSVVSANAGKDAAGQQALASASREDAGWNNSALASATVYDFEGNPLSMESLIEDKATVVNVWATWCPYCIDEMQDYQELYDKYGDRVQFIMLDSAEDSREISAARDYIEERGFTFPVFFDANWELQELFNVIAYPTTIVIDSSGKVISNNPGRIVASSLDATLADLVG